MKKLKKINTIEVKRCFVISQLIRKQKSNFNSISLRSQKRLLEQISYTEFKRRLKISKIKVLKFSEKKLDKIIYDEWRKRLKAYDNCDWYLCEVFPKEAGVWRKAGGLPTKWTDMSLYKTVQKIKKNFSNDSKFLTKRVKYTIQNMLKTNVNELQNEKYLLPIMFQGGIGTRGRKKLKYQTKYDIDDGCMRSMALTMSGAKKIKAYIGFQRK